MNQQPVTTTVYLQIQKHPRWPHEGKVVTTTQKKPSARHPDTVVVKLNIQLPRAAFEPLTPEASITVPDSQVEHPVVVEVEDPVA